MKKIVPFLLILFVTSFNYAVYAQKGYDFDAAWIRFDKKKNFGKVQDAKAILDSIYNMADISGKTAMKVKIILKDLELEKRRNSDFYDTAYVKINNQLSKAAGVEKSIWNSVMGQFLYAYYSEYTYQIYGRTAVAGERNSDFKTWDTQTLVSAINSYYLASLENDLLLKQTSMRDYEDLLASKGEGRLYRPTLYDFLAFRAFNYFSEFSPRMPIPTKPFEMNDEAFFGQNNDFINLSITSPDSLSLSYHAMKILQNLTLFHLQDKNPQALIEISLNRYDFVSQNYTLENKYTLQYEYLSALERSFKGKPGYAYIPLKMGEFYSTRGNDYKAGETDSYRWDYKTALTWFDRALLASPDSFVIKNAQAMKESILNKSVSFSLETIIPTNEPALYSVMYKNIDTAFFRIIPISKEKLNNLTKNYSGSKLFEQLVKLSYTKIWHIVIPKTDDLRSHTLDDILPAVPYNSYILLCSPGNFNSTAEGMAYQFFTACDIAYRYRENDNVNEFLIFNRKTGEPIPHAKLDVYISRYNQSLRKYEEKFENSYKSDKNGEVEKVTVNPKNRDDDYMPFSIQISALKQKLESEKNLFYAYPDTENSSPENPLTYFFTDRKIYRPGQVVYYKGIVLKENGNEYTPVQGMSEWVYLCDPNYQVLDSARVTTNTYGSYTGSFMIPGSSATGQYSIEDTYSSSDYYFRVEEYKRPKFEVEVKQPEGNYKLNETVAIKGSAKAYSGYPIDGATVKYRVVRTASFPFWRYWWNMLPVSNQQEIENGSTTSDETGNFTFSFKALPDEKLMKLSPVFNYKVMVDVTDISGETHSSEIMVKVGTAALQINFNLPAELNKQTSTGKFKIATTNLSNQPQPTELTLTVSHLVTPKTYLHDKNISKADTGYLPLHQLQKEIPYLDFENQQDKSTWKAENLFTEKINTAVDSFYTFKNISNYKNGYYKILLEGKDLYNTPVTMEYYLLVYDHKTAACPAYEPVWLIADKTTAEPGETISYTVGSYLDKAHVLIQVFADGKKIRSENLVFRSDVKTFRLPVLEEYRGNIVIYATVSQYNKSYDKSVSIRVPFSNKQLDFEFLTFRNKVYPGAKEQWKLKIKGPQSDKVAAELLCSMYDASLDAFAPVKYALNLYSGKNYDYTYNLPFYSGPHIYYTPFKRSSYSQPRRVFESLDWNIIPNTFHRMAGRSITANFDSASEEVASFDDGVVLNACVISEPPIAKAYDMRLVPEMKEEGSGGGSVGEPAPQIRSNFNETAFFFPQLETDAEGNIIIDFTMPESLTKWKFLGLAHTQDMKVGTFEKFVQTQKDLMIVPNQPRFFREGDTLFFTAKVVNLVDRSLSGEATLEFTNSINGEKISIFAQGENSSKHFDISKGTSAMIQWKVVIPFGVQALTYKVIAKSGNFSDGEEMSLPVLTNRMLVTESLPLPINGNQTKTFVFKKMKEHKSGTLSNFKYTLEFTSNPAWYAIQSLPYMMEYPYECNEQIFSRLYANALATHIANSSPKIKQVFDSWKQNSPDAFLSNLEKNQELKNIVLEETPWVLDAKNESERKQKIGLLFDIQRMANETKDNINKLVKAQQSNGGWAWFSGLPDNRYITQHILAGFGHLKVMQIDNIIKNKQVDNAIRNGVKYIDDRIREQYADLKKIKGIDLSKDHLGYMEAHYLYTRSYTIDKQEIPSSSKEAFNYYVGQAKKHWQNKSVYTQAMLALALYRMNEPATARDILNSMKQRAEYSEELGMYWKKEGAGFYWYEAPIERQAMLIEAFSLISNDEESVEKMKAWLLKQKQTQNWGTTKATAEACYALLLKGTDILTTDAGVSIQIGNHRIEPDKMQDAEAGTGYIKTSWSESEITQDMSTIVVHKPTQGIAWGSVYWQYFENLDKITPAATPLSIKKNLLKVELGDRGEILTPITEKNTLKTGDKVRVRVEIRVDRDMEYVHLKDMRASAFEPVNVFSQSKYQDGLFYYESTRDAATNFFFHSLPKGTYVFEYTVIASQKGWFSNGITTIQCMYAPEFSAHSQGIRVKVE